MGAAVDVAEHELSHAHNQTVAKLPSFPVAGLSTTQRDIPVSRE